MQIRSVKTASPVGLVGLLASLLTCCFAFAGTPQAIGQQISARISSREAYVGSPIVLQIEIRNAKDFELPEFTIEGCQVQNAGQPSVKTQISIFNGRRTESRSVTQQYLITPRSAGKYEIPELEISVDGKVNKTNPLSFVATKSETGDLLFVAVEGNKEQVFVGEPLELKLKLWIKPFKDRQNRIELTEANMWQMVSNQSSWGSFAQAMQEMANRRERPSGRQVLKQDGEGNERSYFLYEINATTYPTKPGTLDASDLQVVVDYPLSLGRSRDLLDSFFDDDLFGGSPFGRRLTVNKSRPIVATANVDSTEVLPIPTANRPADYRGAVGRYKILTEAPSRVVNAGDPLTLKIGVIGDGPMELVQAPPLHVIPAITKDFLVTDQSMGGFVEDDTKVFVTTIRPKNATIKQIPAIPFSFFDPDKATYETVYSTPIPITVNEAETLGLDSIVSNNARSRRSESDSSKTSGAGPNLKNNFSLDLLESQKNSSGPWWSFFLWPAAAWGILMIGKASIMLMSLLAFLRSAKSKAQKGIAAATDTDGLVDALIQYVADQTETECDTPRSAVGELRLAGLNDVAIEFESFIQILGRTTYSEVLGADTVEGTKLRNDCLKMLDEVHAPLSKLGKKKIRSKRKPGNTLAKGTMMGLLLIMTAGFLDGSAFAQSKKPVRELTRSQRRSVLDEANRSYQQGEQNASTSPAASVDAFARAARKYELLTEQGIRNSELFTNLANAYWRCGRAGEAIVNYKRALAVDPTCSRALTNLRALEKQLGLDRSAPASQSSFGFNWNTIAALPRKFPGTMTLNVVFAIASIAFWLLVGWMTFRWNLKQVSWVLLPGIVTAVAGICLFVSTDSTSSAIVVVDQIELRTGDGREFLVDTKLDPAIGLEVDVLNQRGSWARIRTRNSGETGWVMIDQIESLR